MEASMNNVLKNKTDDPFPGREDLTGINLRYCHLWRAAAVIIFLFWAVVFFFTLFVHHVSDPGAGWGETVLAVSGIATLLVLAMLIVYPLSYLVWAGLCCFWGLALLWDSGDILGVLFYCLGAAFAYKRNFFRTFTRVKIILAIVLPLAAAGAQYHDGVYLPLVTLLRCVFLALAGGAGILLFTAEFPPFLDKKISGKQPDVKELAGESSNPLPELSGRDKTILKHVREGEKYASIAHDMNMSEPHLKRQVKRIYETLGVSGLRMFKERYEKGMFPDEQVSPDN
jgi:DNA-binding CsgD family transcriptional regulator